ncbi:MAG: 4-hydroxythreonine-4-phosphate dehydrogenase PdxA, partial [Bacteroidales bacterium]|nr:4-hydroxythreonine-4-phosphate dehydrogenase PdxA [Bacteroidales bacterium]
MEKKRKPLLAITMGDPAGIGPEIAVKAFAEKAVFEKCCPILMGNVGVIQKIMGLIGIVLKLNVITKVGDALFEFGTMDVLDHPVDGGIDDILLGEVSSKSGDLAFRCVKSAIDLAISKQVDATVTGPINKAAINAAGHHFSGHTEIYAHFTNTSKYGMLLADEQLKVIHVSTHVSLRQAIDLVRKPRIMEVIRLMDTALRQMGLEYPK